MMSDGKANRLHGLLLAAIALLEWKRGAAERENLETGGALRNVSTLGREPWPSSLTWRSIMRRLWQRGVGLLLCVVLPCLSVGCATAPVTGRRQLILISPSQELALGLKSYREILSKSKLSQDKGIVDMVNRVGWRIARVTSRDYATAKDYEWEFNVIEDEKTANAFALPGGKTAIYTGILKYTQNEAGLATVIGHEVGHSLARHGAERMSQYLAAALGQVALNVAIMNEDPTTVRAANIAYGAGATVGVLLPYSRAQESEADRIGLVLMAKAGYDPREAVGFWERLAKAGGQKPPAFLSTHPAEEKRIAQIRQWIPEALRYYQPQ
jgi:predicted Zn-dependent protease